MSFDGEVGRAHVGHPNLDRAKALGAHPRPVGAHSLSNCHDHNVTCNGERHQGSSSVRARCGRRSPVAGRRSRTCYEFPYWLKRAFGADALRAALARRPRASNHPSAQQRAHSRPGAGAGRAELRPVMVLRTTHLRAADPIPNDLPAGTRHQGRSASRCDGLRPPLTPDTAEHQGWLSDRWLSPGRGRMRGRIVPRTT